MAEIRTMGPEDAKDALDLVVKFGTPEAGLRDLGPWLANDNHVMIGAYVDGTPAGLVYGYHLPHLEDRPDMFLLFSIDVGEAFRRQGIGAELMQACQAQARGTLWLLTDEHNEAAMALYRGAGGERPHTDDVMFRFPAVPGVPS